MWRLQPKTDPFCARLESKQTRQKKGQGKGTNTEAKWWLANVIEVTWLILITDILLGED